VGSVTGNEAGWDLTVRGHSTQSRGAQAKKNQEKRGGKITRKCNTIGKEKPIQERGGLPFAKKSLSIFLQKKKKKKKCFYGRSNRPGGSSRGRRNKNLLKAEKGKTPCLKSPRLKKGGVVHGGFWL